MPSEDVAPPSPAPKRPGLPHRNSTNSSSQISASPSESHTSGRPGHHKPHKHVVGHGHGHAHGRMGRNPSFHRSLSKIKIPPVHPVEDDGPPTPKAKHHRRTASSGAAVSQLPASLAELAPQSPGLRPGQGMKRNNTSVALPRLNSQTTLKKNLSSGQLTRLGSSRSVASHAHKSSRQERPDMRRAHTQPYKRHKSPAPEVRQPQHTVHWNVASEEDDDGEQMEGVDDVWTEESASASPNTTRDNTRNNTRQNSIVLDPSQNPYLQTAQPQSRPEDQPPDEPEHVEEAISPTSQPPAATPSTRTRDFATQDMAQLASYHQAQQLQKENEAEYDDEDEDENDEDEEEEEGDDQDENGQDEDEDTSPDEQHRRQQDQKEQQRQHEQHHQPRQSQHHPSSSFQQSRPLDTEAISKRLLEKNAPAPPRVSSISALANAASADPKSLSQTQNGNLAPTGANNTPVVSRFVGPEEGIGSKDATPRTQSGFLRSHSRQTSNAPQQQRKQSQEGNLQRNKSAPNFTAQDRNGSYGALQSPTTPGAQTPDTLLNNSRTQQKLWLQRGLSNIEASSQVHLPGAFPTARAQAMRAPQKGMQFEFVDKEYAVVRRFHNTLFQGVERIRLANGGTLPGKPKKEASTNGHTANGASKRPTTTKSTRSVKSMGSTSARSQRESAGRRARVSFHTGASPESGRQSPADDDDDDDAGDEDEEKEDGHNRPISAAEIARRIWESDIPIPVEV